MRSRVRLVATASLVLGSLLLVACVAAGEAGEPSVDQATHSANHENGWELRVTPYLWAPVMDGEVTAAGVPADQDLGGLLELGDELEFAAMARVELQKSRYFLFVDAFGVVVEQTQSSALTDTSIESSLVILEGGGGYELGQWQVGSRDASLLRVDLLGGGRYIRLGQEITATDTGIGGTTTSGDQTKGWVDPFVGGRGRLGLTRSLSVALHGDIGGFGVSSDLAWGLLAALQYSLCDWFSLTGGYRVLDVDYADGSGDSEFKFDVQMRGPMAGATLTF